MSDEVLISREGAMGVITLNRPRALNALSQAMIDTIYQTLLAWRADDGVAAVLFEGAGERAFCAGGDIRAARDLLIAGETEQALGFYEHEYRNNLLIATYAKPITAIGHGYVMGGGIGLAGHAGIRIAVEGAQYAMPESAIGLFCDIGVNARLAHVAAHRALLFEFAGLPVGVADAIALDLADLMVAKGQGVRTARGADRGGCGRARRADRGGGRVCHGCRGSGVLRGRRPAGPRVHRPQCPQTCLPC